MSIKILSAAVVGLEAELVEIEADKGGGDWGTFSVVGLPDTAVSESRERVKSAIKNTLGRMTRNKMTVNMAPADLKKHGPSYDLPIAVSVLLADDKLAISDRTEKMMIIGELALSGRVRPVNGLLPIALLAQKLKMDSLYVPDQNAKEAKLAGDIAVYPVKTLGQLLMHLEGGARISPLPEQKFDFSNTGYHTDMAHIRGQEHAKRATEVAAAGAHNLMMSGPPGSGKTLIARAIPSILPDLTLEEALEITKVYSVAGYLSNNRSLVTSRPFRSPHHTASGVALVGGGAWPRPGEISLAHRGVLFLDEFAEFPRLVLENLRQPLEDGIIHVSRAAGNLSFPAKFILVTAMNPCPCGYATDPDRNCTCSPVQIANYKKKISGPIIDRIDLHAEVPRISFEKLEKTAAGKDSAAIKKEIEAARIMQKQRFKDKPFITNSEMDSETVKELCPVDRAGRRLLKNAVDQMHLSARSYFRMLKLARTIADLAGEEKILPDHVAEALQYRPKMD